MPFGQFTIPGFNPYAPMIQVPGATPPYVDPGVSGMPAGAPQQPQGLLSMFDPRTPEGNATLLNLGAGLLAGSSSGQGFGAIAGQALQGALAQRQKSIDDELQRVLLKAKIKQASQKESRLGTFSPGDYTPESVAKFEQTGNPADLVRYVAPTNVREGGQIGNYNPGDYTPESFAKYLQTGNVADLVRYVAPANPTIAMINGVPTAVQPSKTGGQTSVNPLSTPEQEEEAKRRLAAAQSSGEAGGKIDTERAATFQQDMNVIDDEILRTQRLLTEFEQGKYQTGPIAGSLPSIRSSAQNLEREQARDVVKNISSATFGALSEGEREFLKGIGIDPKKNEEANVAYLEEKLSALRKAKQRLQTRPPLSPQGRGRGASGSFDAPTENDPLGIR